MADVDRLVLVVVIGTMLVLAMVFFVVMLLVVNANRRHRHRAAMAEMELKRDRAVMDAEREATRQTLREVGRELHDNVGQLLTVVQLGLNTAIEENGDPRLSASRNVLEQGIDEVRRLGRSLNTDLWEDRSFTEAITAEAERLERIGHVKARVLVNGDPPDLPADSKTILFRVFQEIISNALRHGGADVIEIVIHGDPYLSLSVIDNGTGFDTELVRRKGGIQNIRQRCQLIGFEALCKSAPGAGCRWHIRPVTENGA